MAGSRFPGSRVIAFDHLPRDPDGLQWFCWSSAIRLQLRGQPRNCPLRWTHRIPLDSPCGHYRSRNWHLVTGPSISGQVLRPPGPSMVAMCCCFARSPNRTTGRGPGSGRQSRLCRSVRNDHSRSPESCLSSLVNKCSYWRIARRADRKTDRAGARPESEHRAFPRQVDLRQVRRTQSRDAHCALARKATVKEPNKAAPISTSWSVRLNQPFGP